jgi:hypothetical protein
MIRVARIVSVLGKADNGRFNAQRVKLSFHDSKYEVSAYAKKLTDLDFLVEIVSALIGREINLPIPEPVIAVSMDDNDILFASVDVKYPDLTRRLTFNNDTVKDSPDNQALFKTLSDWPTIHQAIGFDEWIANGDRNTGNVLYDGANQFFLIDHNLAMRPQFMPESPINNALLNIKLFFTQDEVGRQRIKNHIAVMISDMEPELPKTIVDRLLTEHDNLNRSVLMSMVDFLNQRLQHLTAITHQKIVTRQLSL